MRFTYLFINAVNLSLPSLDQVREGVQGGAFVPGARH